MSDVVLGKINSNNIISGQNINDNTVQKAKSQYSGKAVPNSGKSHNELKSVSPNELKTTINKINEHVSILNKDVKFVYNDTIKSLVVKVINAKTGRVIREIPPKEVINLQKKLSEVVGIIFDSKEVR